jgi:hypothetical protein
MLPKIITIIFFAVIICLIYNQLQITKQINNLTNSVKVINNKISKRKKDKKQSKSNNLCNFKQMSKNKCYITSNQQENNLSDSEDIDSNIIEQLELQTSESETSNQIKQINNDSIQTEDIKGQGQISLSLINNDEKGKSNTTIPIKLNNVVTAIFNKNLNIDITQSDCIFNDDDIISNLINKVNINPITVSHNDPRVEILSDNQTLEDINTLLNSELNNSNDELINNILKQSDEKHLDEKHLDEKHLDEKNLDEKNLNINQSDDNQSDDNQSDDNQLEDNKIIDNQIDNHPDNHPDNHSDEIKLKDTKIDNNSDNYSNDNHSDDNHLDDNQLEDNKMIDNQIDNHSDNHSDEIKFEDTKMNNNLDNHSGGKQTGNQTGNQRVKNTNFIK